MKFNISLSLCLGVLLATTSCQDFLEESPKTSLTTAAYIASADQAESNTNYLYRVGAPSFYGATTVYDGNNAMYGGYLSGYFANEYNQLVVYTYSQNLSRTALNIATPMDNLWYACYSAINNANIGISEIPALTDLTSSEAAELVAESKFFRASNYFFLVKMFGGLPLYISPSTSADGLELERSSIAEVYDVIVTDLKEAIEDLPAKSFNSNGGRITKNVAYTLLANVYLQMSGYPLLDDHYAEAAAAAKAVISSGFHSLTQNDDFEENSAYNKLRTTDWLPENIYSYEYDASANYKASWTANSLPASSIGQGFTYSIITNTYQARGGLIQNVYNPDTDLRIQNKQLFVKDLVCTKDDGTTIEMYDIDPMSNYFYFDEEAMLSSNSNEKDRSLFRYAEVLLVAAEATAKSGSVSEAAAYLAEVQARASLTESQSTIQSRLSALGTDAFVEEVWAERLRELYLDMRIWDDICRTRQYPTFDENNKGSVEFINVVGASNNWGQTFSENDLLWPISADEIQRNPSLTQNPGY